MQASLADNEEKQKQFTEKLQHERAKLTGGAQAATSCC